MSILKSEIYNKLHTFTVKEILDTGELLGSLAKKSHSGENTASSDNRSSPDSRTSSTYGTLFSSFVTPTGFAGDTFIVDLRHVNFTGDAVFVSITFLKKIIYSPFWLK